MKRNASTSDGAAVWAIAQDTALTRLQNEHDALMAAKRFSEAHGVILAMGILRRMDLHVIPQTNWRESKL